MGKLSKIFGRWGKPSRGKSRPRDLGAIQVEVTTRCNHSCLMCPASHHQTFRHKDLEWELYTKLSHFFTRVKLVFLQGWGEPLLHPRLFDMVALARERGCQTGFTTNGSLLDAEVAREALRLEVNYITVSLAGAEARTHNRIRKGSDFEKLIANVARLVEMKKSTGRAAPKIHLSFLMNRDSIVELSSAVRLAHELEVDRLVVPNLDCPVTLEDEQNRIFDWNEPEPAHQAAIEEAQSLAARLRINVSIHRLQLGNDVLTCELNPLKMFFVNVQGEVCPCVYTSILGQKSYHRYFQGEKIFVLAKAFGSLAEEAMENIWDNEKYRRFRHFFKRRIQRYTEKSHLIHDVRDLIKLEQFYQETDRILQENPFPQVCQKCYKAYGA